MPSAPDAELARLREACRSAGIELHEPQLLGLGDSATFAVNDELVAKVTRWPAQRAAAHRDVSISRWLTSAGLPAVVAAGPAIDVEDSVVTFWRRLPATRAASPAEIATYLRRLHATAPPPELGLPAVQPFVRIEDRIARAAIRDSDKQYLRERLADLTEQWSRIGDLPAVVIHGDPHGDNVRTTADGIVLVLDLERFALGPAEWDLTRWHTAFSSARQRSQPPIQAESRWFASWSSGCRLIR